MKRTKLWPVFSWGWLEGNMAWREISMSWAEKHTDVTTTALTSLIEMNLHRTVHKFEQE